MTARWRPGRAPLIVLGTSGLLLLGSCASLGGNVRGSFSCDAPDGVCAPSGVIDDRALAGIAGGGEANDFIPAAAPPRGGASAPRVAAPARPVRPAPGAPERTQERVLRIVFQSYIDERGRLHEATAVHAVVESGDWQQAFASPPWGERSSGPATRSASLAEAVDRADPPQTIATPQAAGLPTPEAVSAARARKLDPAGAARAGVSDRLAPAAARSRPAANLPTGAVQDSAGRKAGEANAPRGEPRAGPIPVISAPGFPARVAKDE